jgi:SPP1 family predicted phage head-tail adaptor
MNRRIELQCQSASQDDFGQPLTVWTTYLNTWASIDAQNSQLKWATSEFISKATYRICIRWTPNVAISAKHRIIYKDVFGRHVYEIQSIVNTKAANTELVLLCYELDGEQ